MKVDFPGLLGASLLCISVPAAAQEAHASFEGAQPTAALSPPQPTAMVVGHQHQGPVLRSGTSIPLRNLTELTTRGRQLRVGHRFNLEVAEPVTVEGQVVIPAGSPAVGEV